ncbi:MULTISPECIES: dipeptidase PepV [Bacillus]|uniref:Dipeptidase PepV n=2 Tax=Bacillus TaxID=1386 RepID=A0A0M4FH88_9BACI|nr:MULTISPECIES: dipeptidase PepV [Bacillus]ALC82061.1 dipeptidase PepV [Bacillus gobiensis]MBP1083408.1 succinyl-diaminopimelate desuccinylase [Bacillus capparidis]MED1097840.1 dipeptidase PepV [Bacillus capparidis]
MNWVNEVFKRKEELVKDTQMLLQIESVLDKATAAQKKPFGAGIARCLQFLLQKAESDGFTVKNLDGYAAHIEWGEGEEIVGVLCHIDVVPPGDNWTSDPFSAEIRDGKIFARGAIDDKGPTMAAYYALKIVKELNLSLKKRVRLIIGTDEESDWNCVKHYFKHEEMPVLGFAPDADFPIINSEKGLIDFYLKKDNDGDTYKNGSTVLHSFSSGLRLNMVPGIAEARLQTKNKEQIKREFNGFLENGKLSGKIEEKEDLLYIQLKGKSAHAAEPDNGVNAGLVLADFLVRFDLDENSKAFFEQILSLFFNDTRGRKLGIDCKDSISGELTLNVGILEYNLEQGGKAGVNIRYPVSETSDRIKKAFEDLDQFRLENFHYSKPHHVAEDHQLITVLKKVYEEQTGKTADLISIGGATYARSLESGVAFGPLFPGKPDTAHQSDEYIEIDDLLKAASLYAQAIYELAR